jgi:hypothetical protein
VLDDVAAAQRGSADGAGPALALRDAGGGRRRHDAGVGQCEEAGGGMLWGGCGCEDDEREGGEGVELCGAVRRGVRREGGAVGLVWDVGCGWHTSGWWGVDREPRRGAVRRGVVRRGVVSWLVRMEQM